MSEQEQQGDFPQNESRGPDPTSTSGNDHSRPGEQATEDNVAGQGLGQMGERDEPSGGDKG